MQIYWHTFDEGSNRRYTQVAHNYVDIGGRVQYLRNSKAQLLNGDAVYIHHALPKSKNINI